VDVKEYSPYESFVYVYRRLWLVALLTLLGGLAGLLFQRVQPPIYEAQAVLELNVDLTQSDFAQVQPLTELEQDQSIAGAQGVIVSQAVMEQTAAAARAQQIEVDDTTLVLGRTIFLERKHAMQILRVRHADPQTAARLANLWSDNAYQALAEAHSHAVQARFLKEYLAALESCPDPAAAGADAPPFCQLASVEELQAHVQEVTAQLHQELLLGKGVNQALRFDQMRSASPPGDPVSYRTNFLVLAGVVLGFAASAGALSAAPGWTSPTRTAKGKTSSRSSAHQPRAKKKR
jgi:uncharacterized protein involved in exopolysaccharide biosynthesis